MRIAITGASGFIGKALLNYLAETEHELFCMTRQPAELVQVRSFPIRFPSQQTEQLIQEIHPDVLIHAAGRSSVPASVEDPAADFHSGPPVVFQLLNACRLHSPGTVFLFLSSAAVYGNPKQLPIMEHHDTRPISPYGFHKFQSELVVREFASIYGIACASARIFSAYGAGLRRQILWDVCQKAWDHDEIPLLGSGSEARDFIHVLDVCRALELIWNDGDLQGQAINICSGIVTPIAEIASLIASKFPHSPNISFTGNQLPGAPTRWQGDNEWLRSHGYQCSVSLDTGVDEYVKWYIHKKKNFADE